MGDDWRADASFGDISPPSLGVRLAALDEVVHLDSVLSFETRVSALMREIDGGPSGLDEVSRSPEPKGGRS